ncbi:hypothetical protein AVEN_228277-1 [Araneus ventricosus]|uniref:Uncharacterized protein n=1 Tax=Araneus ventricosus TaxID=182803 RepID=A0A4Y2E9F4_ARAVE|nr:hypothetical protein AVEN_228277-1 [Araneus ventricosus]
MTDPNSSSTEAGVLVAITAPRPDTFEGGTAAEEKQAKGAPGGSIWCQALFVFFPLFLLKLIQPSPEVGPH